MALLELQPEGFVLEIPVAKSFRPAQGPGVLQRIAEAQGPDGVALRIERRSLPGGWPIGGRILGFAEQQG